MAQSPPDQPNTKTDENHTDSNSMSVIGQPAATIPQQPPANAEKANPGHKRRWTNDPGMFWLTLFGLLAVIVYTYYTRQLVIDAESASAQQAKDLQTSFNKTDQAIAATNRIAEEAARTTTESHRLADAAAQSAVETRQLAEEAAKSAAAAAQANALSQLLLMRLSKVMRLASKR